MNRYRFDKRINLPLNGRSCEQVKKSGGAMIGIWSAHAQSFLFWFMAITLPVFAIPLALAPMTWGRLFRWRSPDHQDLTYYFGRCLGALALSVEYLLWQGSCHEAVTPVAVFALGLFCTIMVIVHVDGSIRKIQPWTETAEIVFWFAAAAACILIYPTG
jgi:hypothetical protein